MNFKDKLKNSIKSKLHDYLFNDSEKYLISMAIEDRIYNLERNSVNDKTVDSSNVRKDISDYMKLKSRFSSKYWK
jgi:hypothetical protein